MNPEQPGVSVIVPVYNQWELVPTLIDCLHRQSIPLESFELLLVDNGSDHVPGLDDVPGFIRQLSCRTPGSYAARNYGAANARGEFLAFTDADCQPEPGWLEALLAALAESEDGRLIVAGAVNVVVEEPVTLTSRYDMALAFPQEQYVSRGYGVTANLALARNLFEQSGGFDAQRLSGGDAEFCRRATEQGARIAYCDTARVNHPARRSIDELVRKVHRLKGGQLRNGPWWQRAGYCVRGFLPPLRAWWRIWRSPRLGITDRFLVSLVQARLWLSEMAESFRLIAGRPAERR